MTVLGPIDTDSAASVLKTTIVAGYAVVNVGGGLMARQESYNGAISGPRLRLNVGDAAIVRLANELDHPSGIHRHGIELAISADGTEVTEDRVVTAFPVAPPPPTPADGTHVYKFKVSRQSKAKLTPLRCKNTFMKVRRVRPQAISPTAAAIRTCSQHHRAISILEVLS